MRRLVPLAPSRFAIGANQVTRLLPAMQEGVPV